MKLPSICFFLLMTCYNSNAQEFTGFWWGASDSLKNIPFSLRALRISIEQRDSIINGELMERINGTDYYVRWKISNGIVRNDSAAFDLLEVTKTNLPPGISKLRGRHFIFKNPPRRYEKSGKVSLRTAPGTYVAAPIFVSRISSKSPKKYGAMPVLDTLDIPFLIIGLIATVSIFFNWRHLELPGRIISIYPLLAYAFAFEPDNPNFIDDPDYPVAYQMFYSLLDWIFYTVLAVFFIFILPGKSIRIRIAISIPLFFLLGRVAYSSRIEPDLTFVSLDNTIESLLIIYLSLYYFWKILKHNQISRPELDRTFWFVSALLIYFIAGFFITGMIKLYSLVNEPLFFNWDYLRYTFRSILFCLIVIVSFLRFSKTANG